MSEWYWVVIVGWAWGMGYVTAIAFEREHRDPFWKGFLDVLTLRILWQRKHTG
jgi:hypothetical protein